jgi:hypothetical protein
MMVSEDRNMLRAYIIKIRKIFTSHTGRNCLTFHDIVSVTDQNETNKKRKVRTQLGPLERACLDH